MTIQEYLHWANRYPNELPTCTQYADLLYEYSLRMRLDYDEARSIVGLWTNKMWAEYLTKTNGKI
jgi:hypothetical protein